MEDLEPPRGDWRKRYYEGTDPIPDDQLSKHASARWEPDPPRYEKNRILVAGAILSAIALGLWVLYLLAFRPDVQPGPYLP